MLVSFVIVSELWSGGWQKRFLIVSVTNEVHGIRNCRTIAPSESARRCASFRGILDSVVDDFESFLKGKGEGRKKVTSKE